MEPANTAQPVRFSAEKSHPGAGKTDLEFRWTFGDGGSARGPAPTHAFSRPGVYPVTLVVDDRTHRATTTVHISVSGEPVESPVLALAAPESPSFRRRPVQAADVYAQPVRWAPNTLLFTARKSRPKPGAQIVRIENLGGNSLDPASDPTVAYASDPPGKRNWLGLARAGKGNGQSLRVHVDATGLAAGTYRAAVEVGCANAINSPQTFWVELDVPADRPGRNVTVDNTDPGFYATPWFWVGHRFCRVPRGSRGHRGFYLTNGGRPKAGEFARFTPDLEAGRYEVALAEETPFSAGVAFDVRVRCASGDSRVRITPSQARVIGTFPFDEGTDGFVEILAEGSQGLVPADAVTFRRLLP